MLGPALSRLYKAAPPACRAFSSTRHVARGRNLLAKFARPLNIPPRLPSQSLPDASDTFETAATEPVAPSLQEMPRPATAHATKIAAKLPAMEPLDPSESHPKDKPVPESDVAMTVAGIAVPAKPVPPGEEDCCMSGCVHCVYTIHADELEEYSEALKEARAALETQQTPIEEWPTAVAALLGKVGGADAVKKEGKDEATKGVDPSLAAFLALENKLKKK